MKGFKVVDHGYNRIIKNVNRLHMSIAQIGVFEDAGKYPTGEEVVDVATWNELGTKHIPARPFIGSTTIERKDDIADACEIAYDDMVTGKKGAKQALKAVGKAVKIMIIRKIDTISTPPLSPITIKRKGHAKPLIDTKLLRSSIDNREVM